MPQLAFLLTLALRVSVILAGMTLVTVAMRRASATRRHLVWACVLTGVLLMPLAMSVGPRWTLPVLPQSAHQRVAEMTATTVPMASSTVSTPTASLPPVAAAVLTVSDTLGAPSPAGLAVAFWAAGLLALTFWLALGAIRLRRLAGQARPVASPDWQADLEEARQRLSISRRVRLLSGVGTPVPLTWGTFQPVILLPDDEGTWSGERRRVVLLHELAHVKRCDCLTQTLGRLTRAIHWFNPLVWIAVRQLARERERACDEMVLASGTRASDYAEHLLSFARPRSTEGWPAAVAMPMARTSQLESRLRSILSPRAPRPSRGTAGPLAMTLAIGALVVAVATVHPVAKAAPAPQARPPRHCPFWPHIRHRPPRPLLSRLRHSRHRLPLRRSRRQHPRRSRPRFRRPPRRGRPIPAKRASNGASSAPARTCRRRRP